MTLLQNKYTVDSLSYDEPFDQITAEIRIVSTYLLPDEIADPEDSLEKFRVTADFSNRVYTIADITDHAGDVEESYAPLVLFHFMREWETRHYKNDGDSPGAVEPFEFTVDLGEA